MSFEIVVGAIIAIAVIIYLLGELYDFIQVKRGIFPRKSETTIEDIKRLRDEGHTAIAISRFRDLPENRKIYTEYGARKKIQEL